MNDRSSRVLLASTIGAVLFSCVFALSGSARSTIASWTSDGSDELVRDDVLVARHSPGAIELTWNCDAPPLAAAFSTRPDAGGAGALAMTTTSAGWAVTLAGRVVTELPYTAGTCRFAVGSNDKWSASVDADQIAAGGPEQVIVSSLGGTGLASSGFRVLMTMDAHGFDAPVWRLALLVGAIAATAAVILLLPGRLPRPRPDETPTRRALFLAAAVLPLGVLLIVQPPFEDDGWVLSTVQNYASSAQYGNYYLSWDAMVPIGAPAYEMFRLLADISTSPVALRVPSVIAATAMWWLARATLRRLDVANDIGVVLVSWSMFAITAVSWLVTLRPEPFTAALATLCLLLVIEFVQERQLRALGLAVVAAALSITIHPAGLVAAAPLIAAVPTVIDHLGRDRQRWAQLASVAVIGVTTIAVGLLLRADVAFWRWSADASVNPGGVTYTWRDALVHYEWLFGAGNAPRRLTLLLPLLALCAYVTRLDRDRDSMSRLPARSFAIALLLLVPVPSKWLWHFGALSGLGVVVVTHEWWRLREAWNQKTVYYRAAALAALVAVFSIGWRGDLEWLSQTGLVSFHHDAGAHDLGFLPFEVSNPLVWIVFATILAAGLRLHRHVLGTAVERPSATLWFAPLATTGSALLVVGVLIADPIVQSPQWSLPRQLVQSGTGSTCGLGDEIVAYEPEVATVEISAAADGSIAARTGLPIVPAVSDVTTDFTRARTWAAGQADVVAISPWFQRPPTSALEISVLRTSDGAPFPQVQYGTMASANEVAPSSEPFELEVAAGGWEHLRLPGADPSANRVRLIIPSGDDLGSASLIVTSPHHPGVTLTRLVAREQAWISPYLRLYFPCITPVPISAGVAIMPRYIIDSSAYSVLTDATSPWAYLADVARAEPLALEWVDGGRPPIVTGSSVRQLAPSDDGRLALRLDVAASATQNAPARAIP